MSEVRGENRRGFPFYGYIGAGIMVLAEILLLAGVEIIGVFFTPLVWSGYVLFVDVLVFKKSGNSYLTTRRKDFFLLLPVSVILWLVFEGYNLFIQNWRYVGLPENMGVRVFGYAWSFATIWPAVLETNELLLAFRVFEKVRIPPLEFSRRARMAMAVFGAVELLVPVLFPSRWWAILVWTGFVFLLDPVNFRLGRPSLLAELKEGRPQLFFTLMASGLACGFLWELWNYWAVAKWIYSVPILENVKIFEMPVVGYLGFAAFGLEVFVMWQFVRGMFVKK